MQHLISCRMEKQFDSICSLLTMDTQSMSGFLHPPKSCKLEAALRVLKNNQIPNANMAPIQSMKIAYPAYGFQVYFLRVQPSEYVQLCVEVKDYIYIFANLYQLTIFRELLSSPTCFFFTFCTKSVQSEQNHRDLIFLNYLKSF